MSLDFARARLNYTLLGGIAFKPDQVANTLRRIEDWWGCYKEWEANDTFLMAIKEERMTIRQGPTSQVYGAETSNIKFTARHRDVVDTKHYPGEMYSTGVDSIKQRMNPGSFEPTEGGKRGKYALGLHDLSGSLLDPTKPTITGQLRWKWGKLSTWVTIFMPMAKPDDQVVFNLLNSMSKELRSQHPAIYDLVKDMRRSMSRIKLAEEKDMGCGLIDVAPTGATAPKFRYGLHDGPDMFGRTSTVDQERRRKGLHYTSILALQRDKKSTSNEIVIAYRQREGTRFPLFTKWDADNNVFLCMLGEASTNSIPNGTIPDDWTQTVQT